ncbi:hypothetical protein [Planomicrobium sp. CPCC 101110]|uniref:hypothetical protein n=1 Tax=Planomicrobium sp. CPCC 101110 TaxID=2599619 RepID=UPI0011B66EFE|nr:hypothetical protein [Planomicrobium sp. CPCC 101110]TWT25903.1 hypothetical protein FQV30_08910 [Planomicrobium sp. CPCC 101110]
MKKLFHIFLVAIPGFYGCAQETEKAKEEPFTLNETGEETFNAPDYGSLLILEIGRGSILIGPPAADPEASYPAYELQIEESAKVEGTKASTSELRKGDKVDVWTSTEGRKDEVVEKIYVYRQ